MALIAVPVVEKKLETELSVLVMTEAFKVGAPISRMPSWAIC